MHIELVDSLRCLSPHEETWLVAAVTRMDGRQIREGTLGCPACRREYRIAGGVGWFTGRAPQSVDSLTLTAVALADERAMRAAALLGLIDAGGIVVLGGEWGEFAEAVVELGAAHAVVLNAPAVEPTAQEVSSIIVDDRLPFGVGAVRAVALDEPLATPELLGSAAAALRSRGRLVGPAAAAVPDGISVVARDESVWVGERAVVASPPVALRSARR